MSEREDNVYKAKLAEQAERYDGKCIFLSYLAYYYVISLTIFADSWKKNLDSNIYFEVRTFWTYSSPISQLNILVMHSFLGVCQLKS